MDTMRVIDGDGHLFEDTAALSALIPSPYKEDGPYPEVKQFAPIDHLHVHIGKLLPGAFAGGKHVGPEEWLDFLEDVGIDSTILYPTRGLAYGRITDRDWAITMCRAYNDWLSETYVRRNDRFNGVALIPMQEPEEAVRELRRAVTELGMVGAMLPSMGLAYPLGAKVYWPVYEEAERLGCALGIHGGSHSGLGMDHFNVYAPVHSLGHPFGQLMGFACVIFNGFF
jgi:predicted TIM-barrel fold metal-dependent hydrolase